MDITRLRGTARGRNRATAYGDLVFAVATAGHAGADLKAQTRATPAGIEEALTAAGSDKTRPLQATVYLTDIARKSETDAAERFSRALSSARHSARTRCRTDSRRWRLECRQKRSAGPYR